MTQSCSGTCNTCRQVVRLVLSEASSRAIPLTTAALGSAVGATTGRNRFANALLGAAVGGAVGGLMNAMVPAAQKWVCGDCGCSDVTPGV